jgi:branched-subunit amino acid ABC-type transport system permease component
MEFFLQQLINGLTLGGIYALIALGYTMVNFLRPADIWGSSS